MFRAINGNQPRTAALDGLAPPGGEIWSFIAPEFFTKLTRLLPELARRCNSQRHPPASTRRRRPRTISSTGRRVSIRTARRDVPLPFGAPRRPPHLCARRQRSDESEVPLEEDRMPTFAELGYTWSTPKAALRARLSPTRCVIFGGGYDPNEDNEPPTADTMGRGIYILDATDGHVVWSATFGGGATGTCTGNLHADRHDVRDPGGCHACQSRFRHERLHRPALRGRHGRQHLARRSRAGRLCGRRRPGCGHQCNRTEHMADHEVRRARRQPAATKRKFLYPPDVVPTKTFDMVLDWHRRSRASAVRRDSTQSYGIVNRFYGLKDTNIGSTSIGRRQRIDAGSNAPSSTRPAAPPTTRSRA